MTLYDRLREALGPGSVFSATEDVIMYEYDYGLDRVMPDLVALPGSTADVQLLMLVMVAVVPRRGRFVTVSVTSLPRTPP